ncbi:class I SAM-dependent methyltransferase [Maridesulfovibrio sp.]|uniref:class I SAM-dependent methyltransferase n=1 Tax=Maridesulfovibrio sp. TaxID=2795000 RepID=UPI002A189A3A|nr:class I SAM-dependent methyltransferase [Maridesulfovibrio sp.]
MKSVMNATTEQRALWNEVFSESEAYFGESPSLFAEKSLALFRENGVQTVLDAGCGQGRDTFLFAENGIRVTALDYSFVAIGALNERCGESGLSSCIDSRCFDLRMCMPFENESFDACYAHMLLCMELTTCEISCLLSEMHRILKPGGLALYSVCSIFDGNYRVGEHLGEELFEADRLAVHFFSEEKIRSLSSGFNILSVERMKEEEQSRDLFCIAMKKSSSRCAPTFAAIGAKDAPLARNRSSAPAFCPGAR